MTHAGIRGPAAHRPPRPHTGARLAALAAAALALAAPAQALTFTTTFAPSVDAAAQAVINSALAEYSALFSDNVNVSLNFIYTGAGLGTSSTYSFGLDYQTYYNALLADASSADDATAMARLALDGAGANNPANGATAIAQGRAGLAALGINVDTSGIANYFDGVIDLNLGITNYDRINIDPNKYDLKAVTQHEVNEVLGTISNVGRATARPMDLFRFTSGGARTFTTAGDDAYFSIDGSTGLARFNQDPGGDYGDFWSCSDAAHPYQVQDACSSPGLFADLNVEITMLDAVGWTPITAVPEPASWVLLVAGLAGLRQARLRRP